MLWNFFLFPMASLSHSYNISTGTNWSGVISPTVDYLDYFSSAPTPVGLYGLLTSIVAVSSEDDFTLMQSVKSGITQAMKSAHTQQCC